MKRNVRAWLFSHDAPRAEPRHRPKRNPYAPLSADEWSTQLLREIDVMTPARMQSILIRLTLAAERDARLRKSISQVLASFPGATS
jgi:hypothetical protein